MSIGRKLIAQEKYEVKNRTVSSISLPDEEKHLIWLERVASVPVPPKPMVVGGRVFGEEGLEPTLCRMASLFISCGGNGNPIEYYCFT
jgi:hypothetical protein